MVGDVLHPVLGFFRKIGHQTRLVCKLAGIIDSHVFPGNVNDCLSMRETTVYNFMRKNSTI